jgi:3-oxoacyl-[acyl-carrier protein] reductase
VAENRDGSSARGADGPLAGRVALVTGVSRRAGIGLAIAERLLRDGAAVLASGWAEHDAEMPWGADSEGIEAALAGWPAARLAYAAADLQDPDAPRRLVAEAKQRFGAIDVVVANHARNSGRSLSEVTADELDRCFAVNARASVLLAQALAAARDAARGGRVVLFTSGQYLSPMPGELAYAISKGAIQQMTPSLADALAERGITVNCVHPGPVDTGYATGAAHAAVARRFPSGRWGRPDDVARLVAWLVSDEAEWLTGQVISSEGGFRRWA